MEESADEPWISEAAEIEKFHDMTHKRGTFMLVYQLGISTVKPLLEDHMRQALIHLYRKCPCLGICFGQRNGVAWLRHVINPDIDFQVVSDIGADEVRYLLHKYQYNSETGPLWCARLLEEKDDDHTMDEGFPHTYQLLLGTSHSIADGVTLMNIFGSLVKLLNEVIDGKPINDKEQIGRFVSDLESEKLVSSKMADVQNDPALMQELNSAAEDKGIGMPLLSSIIPPPENGEDKTHNLTHVLDKATTKRFINRCKTEGLAVHSVFVALANASTVTSLVENNHIRDSYRLSNGHMINLRRYWPGDTAQVQGCHAHFPLNLWVEVPRDIHKKFWDFARHLHQDLHYHLKEESILKREAHMKLNVTQEPSCDEIFYPSSPMQVDGGYSNLGDVTASVTEGGPHAKPYILIRHTSLHKTDIKNFAHFFHTFRGRLILNMAYNTKFVTKIFAQKHCNQIFSIMEKLIDTNNS